MEDHIEVTAETRKDWNAPELKKIDVEVLTANGFSLDDDGDGEGSPTAS